MKPVKENLNVLQKVVFGLIRDVAEEEIPSLEISIARLKKDLELKEKQLEFKTKVVKEACDEYGFVLKQVPIEQCGPYRLEVGEGENAK